MKKTKRKLTIRNRKVRSQKKKKYQVEFKYVKKCNSEDKKLMKLYQVSEILVTVLVLAGMIWSWLE